jgi:hypothetical protein
MVSLETAGDFPTTKALKEFEIDSYEYAKNQCMGNRNAKKFSEITQKILQSRYILPCAIYEIHSKIPKKIRNNFEKLIYTRKESGDVVFHTFHESINGKVYIDTDNFRNLYATQGVPRHTHLQGTLTRYPNIIETDLVINGRSITNAVHISNINPDLDGNGQLDVFSQEGINGRPHAARLINYILPETSRTINDILSRELWRETEADEREFSKGITYAEINGNMYRLPGMSKKQITQKISRKKSSDHFSDENKTALAFVFEAYTGIKTTPDLINSVKTFLYINDKNLYNKIEVSFKEGEIKEKLKKWADEQHIIPLKNKDYSIML